MSNHCAASNHASMESLEPRLLLSVSLPEPANILAPSDDPTLPGAMDTFDPNVTTVTPDSGAPAFAEWTKQAGPDDSVVVSGWQLSDFTGSDHGKDTRFTVFGQTDSGDALRTDIDILALDGDLATVLLDADLPDDSAYMVWAENADGVSYPAMVNTAETWWLGPDEAHTGQTVSIYGRNLSHDAGTTDAWIYLQPDGSAGQWITPTSVNPYKVDFTVPTGLSNGDYEIWIHNGHGEEYGWAKPLTLTVQDEFTWETTPANFIDVTDYGATGNDTTDDATAIQDAIDDCTAGDTLYFPSGTYYTSERFAPPEGVRWLGDGMDSSSLKIHSSFGSNYALIYGWRYRHNIKFEDMTFDGNDLAENCSVSLLYIQDSDNVHLEDVRLSTGMDGRNCLYLNRSTHVFMDGVEFIGMGVNCHYGYQLHFDGCDFYGTNESVSMIGYMRGQISVSNCTAQHYDTSTPNGWCDGRFVWGHGRNSNGTTCSQTHLYVGDNACYDFSMSPHATDQNQGEMIMWELGGVMYTGTPTAVTDNTIAFNDLGTLEPGSSLRAIVLDGKGLGQIREIESFDDLTGTVTLASDWTLNPNTSSRIVLAGAFDKTAIYNNFLDGCDRVVDSTSHIAASGVQPYSTSYNLVVDGNTFNDMRFGLDIFARESGIVDGQGVEEEMPIAFNHYVNNDFTNVRWGVRMTGTGRGMYVNNAFDSPSFFGNVFRDNRYKDVVENVMWIRNDDANHTEPWMTMNLIERVSGENTPVGIDFDSVDYSHSNWIVRNSAFDLGSKPYSGSKGIDYDYTDGDPILINNTWTGFETTYSGDTPGDILATPRRVIDLSASNYGTAQTELVVRNAGTSSLSWSVSDDAAWLSVSPSSGNVAAESDSTGVTISADASSLTPGDYSGTITLSDGANSTKLTVNFTVEAAPLVAHIGMNENGGASTADVSGWGNDGVVYGSPAWSTAVPDDSTSAIDFDGVDDYINLGNDSSLYADTKATIAFWVKAGQQTDYFRLMSKRSGSNDGIEVQAHTNNDRMALRIDTSAGVNQLKVIDGALDGLWNHVAWVVDNGSVTRYLNGQQYGGAQSYNAGGGFGNSDDLVIASNGSQSSFFDGALDDFRFYTDAMTGGDIAAVYAEGVQRVTVEATDADAAEESTDTGAFTVTRTLAGSGALTVNYTTGGTADSGDDYTALTGSVEIPADAASADVTVTPVDDSDFEWPETVELTLSTSANYTIDGTGVATVTIADNENTPAVYIAMDEGSGTTVSDSSGNGNGGTLAGDAGWIVDTPSDDGSALTFDGDGDYVDLGNDSSLNFGDTMTLAMWVRGDVQDGYDRLVDKRDGFTDGWEVQAWSGQPYIGLQVKTSAGQQQFRILNTLNGVWNHVAWVVSGTSVTQYRNGVQYSNPLTYDPGTNGFANTDDLILGSTHAYSSGFTGDMDEFLLYNDALTGTEIASLYAEGVQRISVEASDSDAAELGQDTGAFEISRAIGSPDNLTVNYSTGGSATSGDDYTALSGTATINGHYASTTVTVTPVDDSDFELDETVELTIDSGTGYAVGSPSSAVVTIADDENAPVAHIEMDEGAGTTAYDSSPNGNDASLYGDTAWVTHTPDAEGSALEFDGNDYADLGNDSSLNGGDTATVAFWVKGDPQDAFDRLMGKRTGAVGLEVQAWSNSETIGLRVDTSAQWNRTAPITGVLNGTWNHVAWVVNNGNIRGYLNGAYAGVNASYDVGNGFGNTDDLILGNSSSLAGGGFDGQIDAFRFFDEALAESDIAVLYSEGVQRVTVEASDASADEQSTDTGAFTLKRAIGGGDLTVNFDITGTATSTDDYASLGSSVQIDEGDASADVTVTPVDDDLVEGTESVVMTLAAAAGYAIDTPSSATVNIADNDAAFDGFESGAFTGGEGFVENTWSTLGVMDVVDTGTPYSGDYHLRLRDDCDTQRTVDLTGYSSATLELAWKAVSFETGDGATVEIYDNGSWSTLLTVDDDDDDGAWHTESIDLSSYTLNDEVIFRISADMGDLDDTLYIDDVAVIV